MGIFTWLSVTLQLLQLKLYYTPVNLVIRLLVLLKTARGPAYKKQVFTITSGHGRLVTLHLYSPPPISNSAPADSKFSTDPSRDKPLPVHINFHGGGFCYPLHGIEAPFCSLVASSLGCYVVDADYARAPESPFPAAYEDCMRVLQWVRENKHGWFDLQRITVGGFSAGGNLALAVCGTDVPPQGAEAGEENGKIKGVVAFYPPVDFTVPYAEWPDPPTPKTKLSRSQGMIIPMKDGQRFRRAYLRLLPSAIPLSDPRLSPRYADPARFPDKGRTMILWCEYDRLATEAREMGKVLREAGREPEEVCVQDMGHGWDQMADEGTEGARLRVEMWERAVEVLRKAQAG